MAIPWLKVIQGAIGITDMVRSRRAGQGMNGADVGARGLGGLETRLAGVVVAALKEAFDRDHQRMELERQHIEAERERAERALRLELARQAGDREIGRLRLLAGVAVTSWLGTLFFVPRLIGGEPVARVSLAAGWLLLLAALAAAFSAQSRVARSLAIMTERSTPADLADSGTAGALSPWLIVAGLAAIAVGVLLV